MKITVSHAISLTQPWATLMALGAKVNETRCWPTKYRGWVAIHAAKGFHRDCAALCYQQPFADTLARGGFNTPRDLPLGAIVAVTQIVNCRRTKELRPTISKLELSFGDYSDGRFAFLTSGLRLLREPVPMKGALSIWTMPRNITRADLAE